MASFDKFTEESSDVCDVCLASLNDPESIQTEESEGGVVLTFCSTACRNEFLKEPEKYLDLDDEIE
ncbi:MAG: YHS domain-containing protein [Patescibacteria group bacterium]|jgi:YHS domain-containing protein